MGILSIKYVTGNKLALDTCRNTGRPVISLLYGRLATLVLRSTFLGGNTIKNTHLRQILI